MSSIKTHEPILVASSSSQKKTKRRKGLKKVVLDLLPPNEEELKKIKKVLQQFRLKRKMLLLNTKLNINLLLFLKKPKGKKAISES